MSDPILTRREARSGRPAAPWRKGGVCPEICTACAYCNTPLAGRHEHDHFPVPFGAGGDEWFPVCLNCHDLKDRTLWLKWPVEAAMRAVAGINEPMTRLLFAQLMRRHYEQALRIEELEAELAEREAA